MVQYEEQYSLPLPATEPAIIFHVQMNNREGNRAGTAINREGSKSIQYNCTSRKKII
jgi:hypothetical protein